MSMKRRPWLLLPLVFIVFLVAAALADELTMPLVNEPCDVHVCSKDGHTCYICGQPYDADNVNHQLVSSNPDDYDYNADEHWFYCNCEQKQQVARHKRSCTDFFCTICKQSYEGANKEHPEAGIIWDSDETNHWHMCLSCSDTWDTGAHIKNCDSSSNICRICLLPYTGSNVTHGDYAYQSDESQHWHACNRCGDIKDSPEDHIPNADGTACTVCGKSLSTTGPEETENPNPEETENPNPEETENPNPEETENPNPEETENPNPEETENPNPEETENPDPEETENPNPEETENPDPEETENPDPEETDGPTDTDEPEDTPSPSDTDEPDETSTPSSETDEPIETPSPAITDEPEETPAPSETDKPEESATPSSSDEPETTPDPSASVTPEPSVTPEGTASPDASATPAANRPSAAATLAPTGPSFLSRFQSNSIAAAGGNLFADLDETVTLTMEPETEEPGYAGSVLTVFATGSRADGVMISLSSQYDTESLLRFHVWQESITEISALRETADFTSFVDLAEALVQALMPELTADDVDAIIVAILESDLTMSAIILDEDLDGELVGYLAWDGYEFLLVLRDEDVSLLVRQAA